MIHKIAGAWHYRKVLVQDYALAKAYLGRV
jgi:hypothetical protein